MEAAVEGPAGLILRTTNLMLSPGLLAINVTPLWRFWHALTSQIRLIPRCARLFSSLQTQVACACRQILTGLQHLWHELHLTGEGLLITITLALERFFAT